MTETGEKKAIGARNFLYPMPTILVGAYVNGKPNYLTVAFCGIAQVSPPMIAVALGKMHYTNEVIRENHCFSVNIPSRHMVEVTDYCGMVSGKNPINPRFSKLSAENLKKLQ